MGKRIFIGSFGVRWGLYPGAPDDRTLQHIIDVRGMMDDPIHDPEFKALVNTPGTSPEVQAVLAELPSVQTWLGTMQTRLRQMVDELETREGFESLKLWFHCRGGFQRSVFVVEALSAWLRSEYPQLDVSTTHLTMHQALAMRSAK